MITRVTLAVAVVLIVSSGAYADSLLAGSIWQQQNFSVGNTMNPGMSSLLNLVHGDQEAGMQQYVDVTNIHGDAPFHVGGSLLDMLSGGYPGHESCKVDGNQYQDADLDQVVGAEGKCGVIGVNAFLDAAGAQEQTIGAAISPKLQIQTLGVAADQVLLRSDGAGEGWAKNQANMYQQQDGENEAGSVFEASCIDADQFGSVDGKAGSTASLVGGLNATTAQAQIVY